MNRSEKILSILKDIRPDSDFENSENFIEEFLLDSFDIINLASELESAFSVELRGEDIVPENFVSLKAIEELIEKKTK